ncbi:hypothetical protein [Leptolyngbya iicbica]|uniref:Uncharacterized protein n=2 Tax=Cyanophyceae TaxID=3028117 RepID=A0A4Q7E9Y3_9CYAN|nr:hypothetical protein DYY88_10920 [Leptolyngbya sp. LK]
MNRIGDCGSILHKPDYGERCDWVIGGRPAHSDIGINHLGCRAANSSDQGSSAIAFTRADKGTDRFKLKFTMDFWPGITRDQKLLTGNELGMTEAN